MHSELRFNVIYQANSPIDSTHAPANKSHKSVLQQCYVTPPLKLLTLPNNTAISALSPAHMLHAMLMSSSPGLLAGDDITIDIDIAPQAALNLSTQAFTRVLSMHAQQHAVQRLNVTIADNALFCYLPHPLVLHAGAHLKQSMQINIGKQAILIYGEIIASGRRLNQEHFAFNRLSSHTQIKHLGKPLLIDNIQWNPAITPLNVMGQMEDFSHQASFYYVNTQQTANLATPLTTTVTTLAALLADLQANSTSPMLLGVSLATPQTVVIRGLAHSAEDLQQVIHHCVTALKVMPE